MGGSELFFYNFASFAGIDPLSQVGDDVLDAGFDFLTFWKGCHGSHGLLQAVAVFAKAGAFAAASNEQSLDDISLLFHLRLRLFDACLVFRQSRLGRPQVSREELALGVGSRQRQLRLSQHLHGLVALRQRRVQLVDEAFLLEKIFLKLELIGSRIFDVVLLVEDSDSVQRQRKAQSEKLLLARRERADDCYEGSSYGTGGAGHLRD